MRKNSNLQEIKDTLESIRSNGYSNIDEAVINGIVDIQFNNQEKEKRVTGRAETQQLVKNYIEDVTSKKKEY